MNNKENFLQRKIKPYQIHIITFILVLAFLIGVFNQMSIKGLRPGGVDVIGSKGKTHQMVEYREETGEEVLWNKTVFSGMPIYHRLKGQVVSIDNFIQNILGKVIYEMIWFYLLGFIGMFYLLRSFKLSYWAAVFGAFAFMLIPKYMAYLNIGHFSKFRPIMLMPFVTFLFLSFVQRKNYLYLLGFIFVFSLQIRTQHYQILFYQAMILFVYGMYYLIDLFKKKEYKLASFKLILIILSSVLVIMMVAQPLFVTGEYTPHSIRGGHNNDTSSGLDSSYATSWSLHPKETANWLIPRFFGGKSNEYYEGKAVKRLSGRNLPTYWGEMPFTQAYEYFGIITIFLGLFGLLSNFKKSFIRTTLGLSILALLLSFGRHFPYIYNIFFRYIPVFNKFRVPAMIQVIIHLNFVIWAAFGIQTIINSYKEKNNKKSIKFLIITTAILVLIGFIPFIYQNFSLVKAGDSSKYNSQVLEMIKKVRLEMMLTDAKRLVVFSLITFLLIFTALKQKINKIIFLGLAIILLGVDLIPYVKKSEGELTDQKILEARHFRKTDTDRKLLQDESYFRVFGITSNPFNSNDLSYFHNSIGGYSAAKLRTYQDVIESCIYKGSDPQLPINWNILRMLNTKYIVSAQRLPETTLNFYYEDKADKQFTYKLPNTKPAWFVDKTTVIKEKSKRLSYMNNQFFNPHKEALLEKELPFEINSPDSVRIKIVKESFNKIKYNIYNDKPGLLAISEIYYPEGWKCFVDGKETEIYKTNHILRSVYIDKPGNHEVEFKFIPKTFLKFYKISLFSHIILYLLFIGTAFYYVIQKKKMKNEK